MVIIKAKILSSFLWRSRGYSVDEFGCQCYPMRGGTIASPYSPLTEIQHDGRTAAGHAVAIAHSSLLKGTRSRPALPVTIAFILAQPTKKCLNSDPRNRVFPISKGPYRQFPALAKPRFYDEPRSLKSAQNFSISRLIAP
jgi:hypothetical protein